MLSKENRLKKEDVLTALKKGRRFFIEEGTLIIAPNKTKTARIAVVVGKKTTKTAVARNKTRRQYYAAFRFFLTELQGKDCVLIVKGGQKPDAPSRIDNIKRAISLLNKK